MLKALDEVLFSILCTYILIGGLSVNVSCFFGNILKIIFNTWHRTWSIWQFKFFISSWSLCFKFIVLVRLFYIFPCTVVKHIYDSFLILSERLSNSLWKSDVFLFQKFINIVSILFYIFIEFIILLYTFLVISFLWQKEYMTCWILFSRFSDVLPAFICARAIGNPWSICLGLNVVIRIAKSKGRPIPCVCSPIGNILLPKPL